jgi:hypothetical protein
MRPRTSRRKAVEACLEIETVPFLSIGSSVDVARRIAQHGKRVTEGRVEVLKRVNGSRWVRRLAA